MSSNAASPLSLLPLIPSTIIWKRKDKEKQPRSPERDDITFYFVIDANSEMSESMTIKQSKVKL